METTEQLQASWPQRGSVGVRSVLEVGLRPGRDPPSIHGGPPCSPSSIMPSGRGVSGLCSWSYLALVVRRGTRNSLRQRQFWQLTIQRSFASREPTAPTLSFSTQIGRASGRGRG